MQEDFIKEYEKEGNEGIMTQGACKFCGQIATVTAIPSWNQEEIDEATTEKCDCWEAATYTRKKQYTERANKNIEKLFGEEMEEFCRTGNELVELLKQTISPIFEDKIKTVSIDTGIGIKAKVSKVADKDCIKVERIVTKKQKME